MMFARHTDMLNVEGAADEVSVHASSSAPNLRQVRFSKRAMDVTLVVLFFPIVLLIMAFAAAAIKLSSKGPVLFTQQRYGCGRVPFRVFKLRTMTVMEDGDAFRQATLGDNRITLVGRFLRRTSIDELPQVLNVLRGDMSLVGPRPHALKMDDDFSKKISNYDLRFNTLPGLTGLAQVRGHRGETSTLDKMRIRIESDIEYVEEQSFLLDVKILLRTLIVVLVQRNAF